MKFFSDVSLWWLLPWSLIAVVGTFYYYRNQRVYREGSKGLKSSLLGLRSLALILIGILLLGILIESRENKTQKPVLINLVDNSASMLNYADSSEVKEKITAYLKAFESRFSAEYEVVNYTISEQISAQNPDFTGNTSNLYEGFNFIFNQYYNRNVGGITFISDGNFNHGNNPLYAAEKISLTPVFTVGVGDTIIKRDHFIKNVSANEVAFYKNEFPVEIDIEANKIPKGNYRISVLKEDKLIKEQTLNYNGDPLEFHHVSFILQADQLGFVNYRVVLESLEAESSLENNVRTFFIEVIDSRSKVLILSDAPHPDITAIRQIVSQDQNTEVESKLISDWQGNAGDYSLLILHLSGSEEMSPVIKSAKRLNIPVLYLLSGQLTKNDADKLNLGFQYPPGNSLDEVQAHLNTEFQLFELSDELKERAGKWPPLKVQFGKVNYPGGQTLLSQRIGPVKKEDPMLVFDTRNNQKLAFLIGEGIWRWKLDEYAKTGDSKAFKELIDKTVQYLIVKQNKDPFRVKLPKRMNVQEEILINAEFYNASMERINTPDIDFELTDAEGKKNNFVFAKQDLNYVLSLGKLKEGKYTWHAKTTYNGKKYDRSGEFVVQDISLEKLDTRANHSALKKIAERTNGEFFELENIDQLTSVIAARKDIKTVTYQESSFIELIDKLWLFILIISLLTIEWFVRKFMGAY